MDVLLNEHPLFCSFEGVYCYGDGVGGLEMWDGGGENGAIVGLGVGDGVLTLVVVDGEVVVCVGSSFLADMLNRVYGIAPMVCSSLCLGSKLHVDVFALLPHAFDARGVVVQACGAV